MGLGLVQSMPRKGWGNRESAGQGVRGTTTVNTSKITTQKERE